MESSPSVYSNVISPLSRRLRVIGVVLLAAVVLLSLYGYFGLMPAMARSGRAATAYLTARHADLRTSAASGDRAIAHAVRVRKLSLAVVLAYWGVCALLVLGVIAVAWLDLREINRRYILHQRAIFAETAARADRGDPRL